MSDIEDHYPHSPPVIADERPRRPHESMGETMRLTWRDSDASSDKPKPTMSDALFKDLIDLLVKVHKGSRLALIARIASPGGSTDE